MAVCGGRGSRFLGGSVSDRFNKAYFDKWYRHPEHRVKSGAEVRRQVAYVVGLAEWILERPIRTVLDVGCGEGQWLPAIQKHRPHVRYDGVDSSEYAVSRFGTRRHIQLGGIEDLDTLALRERYDLVVCVGMLNYLDIPVLLNGLRLVAKRTGGLAYLELFARSDALEGDTTWLTPKPATWYRQAMHDAGLHSVGMHGYVPAEALHRIAALERG